MEVREVADKLRYESGTSSCKIRVRRRQRNRSLSSNPFCPEFRVSIICCRCSCTDSSIKEHSFSLLLWTTTTMDTTEGSSLKWKWKRRTCPDLDFISKCSTDWIQHRSTRHADKKPFRCSQCKFRTHGMYFLDNHVRRHQANPGSKVSSPFQRVCPDCDFKSKSSTDWKQHRNVAHDDKEPFTCSSCEFRTGSFGTFCEHQRFHKNGKPFTCNYDGCDFETVWISSMRDHEAVKHLKAGKFKCHICCRGFRSKWKLLQHMKARHQSSDHDWRSCKDCVNLKTDPRKRQPNLTSESKETDVSLNDCLIDVHQEMMNAF